MKTGETTAAVLFAGVCVSFALLIAGLAIYFAGGALGIRFLELGLVVLLSTPFARIIVLAAEFARRGEYAFVGIAAGVLLLLGVSIFVGLR